MKTFRGFFLKVPFTLRVMIVFSLGSVVTAIIFGEQDEGAFLIGTVLLAVHSTWSTWETKELLKTFPRGQIVFWSVLFAFLNVYISVFFFQILFFGVYLLQTVFLIRYFYEWLLGAFSALVIEVQLTKPYPELLRNQLRNRLLRILTLYFFAPGFFVFIVYFLLLAPSL